MVVGGIAVAVVGVDNCGIDLGFCGICGNAAVVVGCGWTFLSGDNFVFGKLPLSRIFPELYLQLNSFRLLY